MKRYLLTIFLPFVIILLAGCSKDVQIMQNFEADKGVRIYEGDKRVIFNLRTLPYDMEYKEYILQFSSCELYQEKSEGNSYIPYVIAKVKIEGFLILQGDGYRALQFIYDGFSDSNVKNLKDLDEEVWRAIKQKQIKSN